VRNARHSPWGLTTSHFVCVQAAWEHTKGRVQRICPNGATTHVFRPSIVSHVCSVVHCSSVLQHSTNRSSNRRKGICVITDWMRRELPITSTQPCCNIAESLAKLRFRDFECHLAHEAKRYCSWTTSAPRTVWLF